jgi:hypothetical protein
MSLRAFTVSGLSIEEKQINERSSQMAKTIEQKTRDWLAKHDIKKQPTASSPRLERWEARRQQRMQERRALSRPLLKGV